MKKVRLNFSTFSITLPENVLTLQNDANIFEIAWVQIVLLLTLRFVLVSWEPLKLQEAR